MKSLEREGDKIGGGVAQAGQFHRLFLTLAEELKLPLMHIARSAELQSMQAVAGAGAGGTVHEPTGLRDIRQTADMTMQLLDSYLLSLRLCQLPEGELELEPVSVQAVLHDTAGQLQHVAAQYGVDIDLHVQGRYEPALAHRQALQSALVSLGYALIEALPASGVGNLRLRLAGHRTRHGIVAGVYGDLDGLTPQMFRRARQLQGTVRQPLVAAMPGSGAGIFVADAILGAMAARLRVGRYHNTTGFAVTLPASEQLQFI